MEKQKCDIDTFAEMLEIENIYFDKSDYSSDELEENTTNTLGLPESSILPDINHTDDRGNEDSDSSGNSLSVSQAEPQNRASNLDSFAYVENDISRPTILESLSKPVKTAQRKNNSHKSMENRVYPNENVGCASSISVTNESIHSDSLPQSIDPLERELLLMEAKMKKLKEEIVKKKKLQPVTGKSDGFTKFSAVIDPQHSKAEVKTRSLSVNEKEQLLKDLDMRKSEIHSGDTDSEDEEDNRQPMEPQFSAYGKDMKVRLAHSRQNSYTHSPVRLKEYNSGWKEAKGGSLLAVGRDASEKAVAESNTVTDPFSGIRIINPLLGTDAFKEMMVGRRMIQMSSISSCMRGGEIEGDWVSVGVIVSKSDTKTSQKGSKYSIWQMSDLKDCTKVVSLFLFAGAYTKLWKTTVGSVAGILNPQIMKDSNKPTDGRNVVTLSVNTHEKLLLLGTSKDLGWCRGRNKQSSNCRQFVNKNVCEFCIFHIQKEYKKMSAQRSEIQSSFTGVDPRKAFQKRVLGKDQVFYGGQLYSPGSSKDTTPKRCSGSNFGIKSKDLSTLSSLGFKAKVENVKAQDKKDAVILNHLSDAQFKHVKTISKVNEELGQMLLAPSPGARNLLMHKTKDSCKQVLSSSPNHSQPMLSAKQVLNAGKASPQTSKGLSQLAKERDQSPLLGRGLNPGDVFELECAPNIKKAKAAQIIKNRGGLQPEDKNMKRNKDKAASHEFQTNVKKRIRETASDIEVLEEDITSAKAPKMGTTHSSLEKKSLLGSVDMNSAKFIAMMNAKSKHTGLIQAAENEEVEKYYNTLEKKEMIENKMASIMEVPTSAVVCLKCKYKATSASDHCRTENHPLKVVKATKRFFECRNCKQRTISLEKLPGRPCKHCRNNSWSRVAMAKNKHGPKLESEILSLRGDELSNVTSASNEIYLHL